MQNKATKKLGDIAEFINGGAWNQTEYADAGIPVVRVSDIHDSTVSLSGCKYLPQSAYAKYAKHELREGDLVICTVGSHPTQPNSVVGRPGIMSKSCEGALLNQNAVCVRPLNESLDKTWLGYFARSRVMKDYIIAHARGSANQVRVAIGSLKDMDVLLPSIEEQKKVADVLVAYDRLIENNTRRIKILEEMAQAIYREWFVNFRFPRHEKVKMVDSPLGPIPEGWEVKAIGDILEHSIGGGWGKEGPDDKHVMPANVIRGTDIPGAKVGKIDGVPFRYHTASNLKNRRLRPGDLIFEVSGGSKDQPVGRALLVNEKLLNALDNDVICASFCKLVRPSLGSISSYQVYLHLEEIYSDRRIMQYQTQSTGISNLKFSVFSERESLLVPTPDVRKAFDLQMKAFFDQIANLGERNRNLRLTCDLLLPKLISSELDISVLDIATGQETA